MKSLMIKQISLMQSVAVPMTDFFWPVLIADEKIIGLGKTSIIDGVHILIENQDCCPNNRPQTVSRVKSLRNFI